MNRVAKFEKVSYEQFLKDWKAEISWMEEYEIREIYDKIKLPERGTEFSAGYDFFSPVKVKLNPGESVTIPTGVRCVFNEDCMNWALFAFPRSGLGFKYALRLANTTGIIDADYSFSDNEGHIKMKLINDSSMNKTVDIDAGKGFIQGVFLPYGVTNNDAATEKRNGGFGSTAR